jgi:hypothetical protein
MSNKQLNARVSEEIHNMIEKLVKHYEKQSLGTVNKSNVVDLIVKEHYRRVFGNEPFIKLNAEMEKYIDKIIDRDNFYDYKEMTREQAATIILSNALGRYAFPDRME